MLKDKRSPQALSVIIQIFVIVVFHSCPSWKKYFEVNNDKKYEARVDGRKCFLVDCMH